MAVTGTSTSAKAALVALVIFGRWLVPAAGRAGGMAAAAAGAVRAAGHACARSLSGRASVVVDAGAAAGAGVSVGAVAVAVDALVARPPRADQQRPAVLHLLGAAGDRAAVVWLPVRQPQLLLPLIPAFFLAFGWLVLDERARRLTTTAAGLDHDLPAAAARGAAGSAARPAARPGSAGIPVAAVAVRGCRHHRGRRGARLAAAAGARGARRPTWRSRWRCLPPSALLAFGWQFNGPRYDTAAPPRVLIAEAQQQGRAVAHVGAYSGQFHFNGRLTRPLDVIAPEQTGAWLIEHPDGLLVSNTNVWQPPAATDRRPFYEQPFGDTQLKIWQAGEI
ncbi:MAG: hypothetical protein MZV65_19295 [Chromatiales bacterium]|nr:hypothetical protein [Chromatiales bacterium]